MGSAGEWSLLVESLAQELVPALRRKLYQGHLDRMATIRSYSEKLVYLYVVLAEPQSFGTIRRALNMHTKTANRSLTSLVDRGCLVLDDRFLYWVTKT